MDYYQSVHPKQNDSVYVLHKCKQDTESLMGIFDLLETALHALDMVSRFKALDMEIDDKFTVSRLGKNSLQTNATPLATWTCTGTPKQGCSVGVIELKHCLRTHVLQ